MERERGREGEGGGGGLGEKGEKGGLARFRFISIRGLAGTGGWVGLG